MENGYLTTSEFAKKAGEFHKRDVTDGTIYQRARAGRLKKVKHVVRPGSPIGKKQYLIHESEIPTLKFGSRAENRVSNGKKMTIADEDFQDVKLSSIKEFEPERGKIPYKNLATAVKLAIERKDFETIEIETGVKKTILLVLINELKKAEKEEPGKYPTVMAYLFANRPYAAWNERMPRKGKK